MFFQLIDAVETYETYGSERAVQTITLIGKKEDGTVHYCVERKLDHYCYMAVSEGYEARRAIRLAAELNEHLLKNHHRCKRLDCPKCKNNQGQYYCFEPCVEDRKTDREAVVGVDMVRARGFTGFEENERPFLRFKVSRSYYSGTPLQRFLNQRQDPALPEHQQGVFDCTPKAVESYLKETGISGFSWLTLDGKPVPVDQQPKASVPLKAFVFDIETPSPSRQFPYPYRDPTKTEYDPNAPIDPFIIPFPTGKPGDPKPEHGMPIASIAFMVLPEKKVYVYMTKGSQGGGVKPFES